MAEGAAHPSWRSALLALLVIAPLPSIGVYCALYASPGVLGSSLWIAAKLGFVLGPALWWRCVQRQPWQWPRWPAAGIGVGTLLGVAMLATIVAAFALFGRGTDFTTMRELVTTAGLSSPTRYLLLAAYWTLINSLIEEYAFRWFLFRQASYLGGATFGVVLSAVLFTVHHSLALAAYVPWHLNLLASLGVMAGGLLWSLCYYRYQSLWPGYIAHVGADIAVFAIGYHLLF